MSSHQAPTACLHLFSSHLSSLPGELPVLLSIAKTSICALGILSSSLLTDLTPNNSPLSLLLPQISPPTLNLSHQHTKYAVIDLILKNKKLDSIPSLNSYLISLLVFIYP